MKLEDRNHHKNN